jgi:hypothetical protein
MHVITSGAQITRLSPVNQLRFIAATEEVPPVPMPAIKSLRVGAQQPFHPCSQIRLRRLQDKMKVIAHQAVGMHLPSGL